MRERDGLAQTLGNIPQDAIIRQQLIEQALENITLKKAIISHAKKQGIIASDAEIAEILQTIDAFKNPQGNFDAHIFKKIMLAQGISLKRFQQNIGDGLIREIYTTPILSEFPLPKKVADVFNDFAFTEVSFTAYPVLYSNLSNDIKKVSPPTHDQLQQIYKEKKDFLIHPALKDIEYVVFDSDSVKDKINISHDKITGFYEKNKDTLYTIPEKRKVLQIILDDKKKASKIYTKLSKSGNFKSATTKLGYKLDDIDLGYVTSQDLANPALSKIIFNNKIGTLTKPIQTDFGYVVCFIEAIQSKSVKNLQDVKAEIQENLFKKELSNYLSDIMPKIDDDLAGGASLEEITKNYGSKIITQENITETGDIYKVNPPQKLNPIIPIDDVNQYDVGDDIPVITNKDNQIIVMKITAHEPERTLTFAEAKPMLEQQDIATQKQTVLKNIIDEIKKASDKNKITKKYNIVPKTYSVKRSDSVPAEIYNSDFDKVIFASEKNQDFSHIEQNKAMLLIVNGIKAPTNIAPDDAESFAGKLQKNYDSIIQDEALKMIRNHTDIETQKENLDMLMTREIGE